ncbi:MAG: phospholipase A, partial [Proteobacteria bacterium]|nr:phospholipase A [Burkholderiales bacterium]
ASIATPAANDGTPARPTANPPARAPISDRFASALSANEPVYVGFGSREGRTARFQISFKYRFFNEAGDLAQDFPVLKNLYFGYTQNSLWDIESDSAPFRDSTYRPSLFYLDDRLWTSAARDVRLGLQTGFEHESNGRDGTSSRSLNTAFVRPIVNWGDTGGWHLTLAPKIYVYLERSENADIARYRGYADLFAAAGHPDGWQFAATLRRGTGNDFGSTLLETTYPLRSVSLGNLDGYFYLQYFNGYGESILDYNRRLPSQLRVGFSITRWP